MSNCLPPKQAPMVSAQMSGCKGRFSADFSDNEMVTFSNIAVSGMLFTNADPIAATHKIIKIATAKRNSSLTIRITFSVCIPIHSMRLSFANDSMSINKTARNSSVDHSTRSKIDSMPCLSKRINNRIAPRRAAQPIDNRSTHGNE